MLLPHMSSWAPTEAMERVREDAWNRTAAGGRDVALRDDVWNRTAAGGSGVLLREDVWNHTAAGGSGVLLREDVWNHTAAGGSGVLLQDDVWNRDLAGRALTGCLLSLLILWTLFGNVLVCAAVLRFRHLRSKVTHVFIVSLALSDLFVAVLVMPWKAVAEVVGRWPFGAFCDVWVAFDIMCSTASILNLCVISMDRYWAISTPFRYERKMTQRVAFVMIGAAWTLSVLISFIPVQLNWHKAAAAADTSQSHAPQENCDSSLSREYAISSSLISFYIPVAIMIVTYTRIYRIAQLQIRRIATLERAAEHAQSCRSNSLERHCSLKTSIRRETKVLKTLSVIVGVFVCCWTPFFVLNCLVPFCDKPTTRRGGGGLPCVSETTFDVFVWIGWTNSSLNPVIYAFNADFRKAFASLLGCRHLCTASAVETANISNELVSYNHDTPIHRELVNAYVNISNELVSYDHDSLNHDSQIHETPIHRELVNAYVNIIPNVVDCFQDDGFDQIAQFSHSGNATDSACDVDDPDISLELFTPNGPSALPPNGPSSLTPNELSSLTPNGRSALTHSGRPALTPHSLL